MSRRGIPLSLANDMQHALSHEPEPLVCYGCCEGPEYTSTATVFGHLESGSCSSGWTIQHINALLCQSQGSNAYIIEERKPWLLAGPPRTEAQDSDRDPKRNSWRCPLCSKFYLSKPDLTRHLQEPDCYQSYPNVLKCPECTTEFTKLSKLLRHVETDKCPASVGNGSIAKLLEHMEVNLKNPSRQWSLSNFEYRLECDLVQPRKLIVKVTSMTDLISLYP